MNNEPGPPNILRDEEVISTGDNRPPDQQYKKMRMILDGRPHGTSHFYIDGTLTGAHSSFRDPFVYLLHSTVDRIWASWQYKKGQEWQLDPDHVYIPQRG
jgi:hypothetical protein